MSEQNKSVVRRIFEEHWNAKSPQLAAELYDENAALYTLDGTLRGHEGAKQLLAAYSGGFRISGSRFMISCRIGTT